MPLPSTALQYIAYTEAVLKPVYEANKQARGNGILWNTEMVPAENLGVRNATWDDADRLYVPRHCYNSYFFVVEDPAVNALDKLKLHGSAFTCYLDGGSACHINLDEHLTKEQYLLLLDAAIQTGCNYLTFNIPNTLCRTCGHINKSRMERLGKPRGKRQYSGEFEVVRFHEYPDNVTSKSFRMVPSYKRMCITILKNDTSCKYMGFGQTKDELQKQRRAMEEWENIM